MPCERCGSPCQGKHCSTCESIEHHEGKGTPAEIAERRDDATGQGGDEV